MKPEVEQFHARVHNVLIVEKTVKSWNDEKLRRVLYVKCEDCKDFAVYYGGLPTLFDTYDAAAKEAIEHARRNLITDEDPKNITSYTGFAQ